MNKSDKKYIGKGATTNSSSLNKAFKPLIASSLALALGVSMASGAGASTTCTSTNGSSMAICGNGTDISQTLGITWNGLNGGTDIYQPTTSSTPIKNLVFEFGSSDTHSGNADNYTATINGTSLTIAGNGKSLQMGDGSGLLKFDFKSNSNTQIALNLNALYGNLELAGTGTGNTFTGTFAGNDAKISGRVILSGTTANHINSNSDAFVIEKGIHINSKNSTLSFNGTNIRINNGTSDTGGDGKYAIANKNSSGASAAFTFSGTNANISIGKVYSRYNGGGITFNITGNNSTLTFDGITNHNNSNGVTINFSGNGGTLTPNIQDGNVDGGKNGGKVNINFLGSGANQIEGQVRSKYGLNTITFADKNTSSIIHGNIEALYFGKNIVNFNATSLNTSTQRIDGSVMATAGNNEIHFKSNASITGSIINNKNGGFDHDTSNIIIFDNGGTIGTQNGNNEIVVEKAGNNIITFNGTEDAIIYANIKTTYNNITSTSTATKNEITFNGSGTNRISGAISATSGGGDGNIIKFTSGTNSILGSITAGEGQAGGKNNIAFDGSSNQIDGSIYANSGTNTIAVNTGGLTITGSVVSTTIMNGSNTIEIKAGNTELQKGIASYTYTDGIHKNQITAESGSTTIRKGVFASNEYAIYANNGNNANEITANILKIYGDIYAGVQSSNTIIAKNAGENVIVGNVTTNGGSTTNLAINGNESDPKSSYLTGNITNNGNMNIILQDATWIPTDANGTSGTITNNGGTTNVVMRKTQAGSSYVQTGAQIPVYIVNAIAGNVNVVIQGNTTAQSNINYGNGGGFSNGNATFIFASENSGSDAFGSTNTNINQVLGKTYSNGVKLFLSDISVGIDDKLEKFTDYYRNAYALEDGSLTQISVSRDTITNQDTISVKGLAVGIISNLNSSAITTTSTTYNVTLNENSAFVGKLELDPNRSNITLTMKQGAKLVLAGQTKSFAHAKLATLNVSGVNYDSTQWDQNTFTQTNTVINLATDGNDINNVRYRPFFRLLEIGAKPSQGTTVQAQTGLVGDNAIFQVYVNDNAGIDATLGNTQGDSKRYGEQYSADRIVIHNAGDNSTVSKQYLQIVYDKNTQIDAIKYQNGGTEVAGNIAVATVVNKSGTSGMQSGQVSKNGVVNFVLQNTLQGFDEIISSLVGVYTDEYGKSNGSSADYTTYFVSNAKSAGASEANREATATAFGVNYDLYMANFNSLNKRMGELRDNPHSQGAWIRIFNGSQTNDMGLGTKSSYTTFQGGYDYAFGFEGANNYVGLAIAYGMSDSKTQSSMSDLNGSQRGVENIKSNAVEVALYNAYVQDEGWYNDTIAKFSYIFSDFNMMGQSSTYSTSNMAFTLSDEFGYRFKLGENKEWTIDPQLEMAFGYFDQSDFVQKLGVATLDSTLDSISTLRTRVGSSFGYDFKKFTENKPIKASVYVGAFYEYDYISGGDVTMTTNLGSTNSINSLSSDGRVVVNVGTNMTIKDNTRIYFDFESSFAGKIRTDYQANVGVRYSFGENTGYTPVDPNKKSITPLKVSDEKAEEGKENTSPESKSETTTEQNTNSTENTTEEKAQ